MAAAHWTVKSDYAVAAGPERRQLASSDARSLRARRASMPSIPRFSATAIGRELRAAWERGQALISGYEGAVGCAAATALLVLRYSAAERTGRRRAAGASRRCRFPGLRGCTLAPVWTAHLCSRLVHFVGGDARVERRMPVVRQVNPRGYGPGGPEGERLYALVSLGFVWSERRLDASAAVNAGCGASVNLERRSMEQLVQKLSSRSGRAGSDAASPGT
jgi:hypothetical protein